MSAIVSRGQWIDIEPGYNQIWLHQVNLLTGSVLVAREVSRSVCKFAYEHGFVVKMHLTSM